MTHARLGLMAAALMSTPVLAAPAADDFLDFPQIEAISAAKVPAFIWIVRQSDRTSLYFGRAPGFRRNILASRSDEDGQPITDARLSPDGTHAAFLTGVPLGEGAFNPAGLVDAPEPTLWLVGTTGSPRPRKVGPGLGPEFTPDGRLLLFRRGDDLWALDTRATSAKPKLFAKGGGDWSQFVVTSSGDLIFVADRRGYSFIGRYRPGAAKVEWLVTGAERLALPLLSPDGKRLAFLRLPGREHVVTDQTESEPFAIDLLDLNSGAIRTLWDTRGKALTLGMDDAEGALRWAGNERLIFYSETDGWGRLYAIPASGGVPRALTPPGCMVAESEGAGDQVLVIHNCVDRDTRQLSLVDPVTGAEQKLPQPDPVLAMAASSGAFTALVGASPDEAALLRIVDNASGKVVAAEHYADYGYTNRLTSAPPREIQLTAADGQSFSGQLFTPATPGPHPGLIYVHGGPQRQMFPAFSYMRYYSNDYAINRMLSAQGYAVLAVNYRSGIGYGQAFRDAPGRAWRDASEYRDVLAAGRWLAAQPDVDPKRIGIWGGSYGGLLTGQALARNSGLFKAGVGIHGVYDWSWPSPVKGHLSPSEYFGVGEADKAQALVASPLGAIAGWRSPVLLISGDRDMNVDVVETIDLTHRLRGQGVEVRTVILPGEAHDFIRQSAWHRMWNALDRFFAEKLR